MECAVLFFLAQLFQLLQTRIDRFVFVSMRFFVKIFTADRAKPQAIFSTYGADWDFQEHILSNKRGEVNIAALRQEQPGFSDRIPVKSKQFDKINIQRLLRGAQTTHALRRIICLHLDLH